MFNLSKILLSLFTSISILGSNNFQPSPPCGPGGSAYPGSWKFKSNTLKNRTDFPPDSLTSPSIAFNDLFLNSVISPTFRKYQAVEVEAYVLSVRFTYPESCNCYTKNSTYMDTHIELVASLSDWRPQKRIIAEITPRFRAIMKAIGTDWSTETLQKKLTGKKVKVKGWLFYDEDHKTESTNEDPADTKGYKNWRGSAWEIHPITSIKTIN